MARTTTSTKQKAQRRCSKKTKAGKPCKASPLRDHDVCLAHADAKTRESTGFIARNGKQGRKPIPKPTDLARQLIEQHIEVVFKPHFRTLGYDIAIADGEMTLSEITGGGAKVLGESRDGDVVGSPYDDLGAMIAAAEKLLDRIYGRPKSTSEFSGTVEHRSGDQINREIERLTERLAEEKLSGNGHRAGV